MIESLVLSLRNAASGVQLWRWNDAEVCGKELLAEDLMGYKKSLGPAFTHV